MSKKILFCDSWQFSKQPFATEYSDNFDWKDIDIPHDYLIENTKNLYETSTGWYRRSLNYVPKPDVLTSIRFEGVYMDSAVFVNGSLAGEWKYGYSTFEFDITELLREGENLIAVRVNYQSPNSRWYSGAGIYRNVWLKESPAAHILPDGVYISARDNTVTVSTELCRPKNEPNNYQVRQRVKDPSGNIAAESTASPSALDASVIPEALRKENCSYSAAVQKITVDDPEKWDIESPCLYTLVTELIKDGQVIDKEECRFGFRKAEFTCDKGFFLNGRHVKLHGSCEHHDLGALGAAQNKTALRRRLKQLREMGVNSIRTSHNMPSVELMEAADEMGFLILSEGFDMWERPKTDYDYARFFKDWVGKDIAAWVRRDRNHPSLIGWSIGNEIYDVHADERGQEVNSMLAALVRQHDPRCNGYITSGSNYLQWENAQKCTDLFKLAGYNYGERLYGEHHEKHPDWMIYGSETASVLQSRGVYHFPLSRCVLADDDEQCSSLGNCSTGWGAPNTEYCVIADRDAEYSAGQFIWSGFDYIGESTPYSTKNSYFGQIDTAGFRKDSSYIFQAEWTDFKTAPFIHIFPYWDFSEGQEIDVRVTTNAPCLQLFFNGEDMGKRQIDHLKGTQLVANYLIPYKKGVLLAIAYDENGNEAARVEQRSFSDAAKLLLVPDKTVLKADGRDLILLEISALDEDGNFVANANNRVNIEVSGAGRLIGLDNGDSTDFEQYKGKSRRLFGGKLLAIIAAKTTSGEITVKVNSPRLPQEVLTLTAADCGEVIGLNAVQENADFVPDSEMGYDELPVRKIELCAPSLKLGGDNRKMTVTAKVFPKDASYKDNIEYRITNEIGISSNLAEICSVEGDKITLCAKGDGRFYLRAMCKNGTDKYRVLTALQIDVEGVGAASFDPYGFVVGGLHTCGSEVGNGIERGAGFEGENAWFGFENTDFGNIGSDTVTVPIYANCTTPVKIRFYDGIPDQGGELIGDFVYHEPPQWLTYQPNTFKLSKVLKGVHTLVMASSDRYHVKGFSFEKPTPFGIIEAGSCEKIYGDSFTRSGSEITGIGNNVVLNFGELDFEEAASSIVICGRSNLPVNSIHINFKNSENKLRLAEFEGCSDYTERRFKIAEIKGKYEVSFTFLPGSSFDFAWFRFEK
ncbi:MAG: DUF4982 domain-containing protein [Firmicutes bacterium]|nr:DUF4982 domain-containing protein [[Eubacterium] siraeum]MCM1488375.1 DUF4982 domain-containing protein [Bacillota bacterium]